MHTKFYLLMLAFIIASFLITSSVSIPIKHEYIGGCEGTQYGCCEDFKTVCLKDCINCKNLTMIGYIPRPNNMSAYLNLSNILFYLKFRNIMNSGDSSLFNNLIKFIEGKGYNIIGAHQISDNLTLTKGLYSTTRIGGKENDNIKIANNIANKIGDLDIGQSVVVARERVLAVEAAEGTNSMLKRIIDLRIASPDKGGVFFKTSQNIQDKRVDMPTIGPKTIDLVIKANLSGIAITQGDVIVLEYDKIIKLINENNLFFIVIDGLSNDE